MKKKYMYLVFTTLLLIFLPTQILAGTATWSITRPNGTKFTFEPDLASEKYKIGDLFEIGVTMTADIFGTDIVAFYEINVDAEITGETYFTYENLTLQDINIEGESISATFTFNLSDIVDSYFDVYFIYNFKENDTSDEDAFSSGGFKAAYNIKVKEASIGIIVPILAVLSITYILYKKQRK